MKNNYLLTTTLIFFAVFVPFLGMSQNLEWAKSMGGVSSDYPSKIEVDQFGNVYTIGHFAGTVDFDPGTGVSNMSSVGDYDIFITKLDASGNYVWAKQFGGTGEDRGSALVLDDAGNIYAIGSFRGTSDFDPGALNYNLISNGNADIFVCKLTSDGEFIWAKSFGANYDDNCYGISLDQSENIYLVGTYRGTVDFDPGSGNTSSTSVTLDDIFVSKFDSSGNFIWVKSIGGNANDGVSAVINDASGNVLFCGTYLSTTIDFDPGPGVFNLTTNFEKTNGFICKLDPSGNFLWAKQLGSTDNDGVADIKLDAAGNIYTTGNFSGTTDFNPGTSVANLVSQGYRDIFVWKLDPNANYIWAKRMGASYEDFGFGITVDPSGNVYTTGYFGFTVDFNPGTATYNLTAGGTIDGFVQKLNASGTFVYAFNLGGSGNDSGYDITSDVSGQVYTTGHFYSSADFDPGAGTVTLISNGEADWYTVKLSTCNNVVTENKTTCDAYTWRNGQTYTTNQSGITYTVPNAVSSGCDSIYILNLTIATNTVDLTANAQANVSCNGSYDGVASVNSATGGSGVYTYNWSPGTPTGDGTTTISGLAAGNYICTVSDENGCTASQTFTITQPNPIVSNINVTECDSYTLNSQVYTSSGNYTQNLVSVNGCDSTLHLNLIIKHSTTGTAVVTACDSYTWIDGTIYTSSNNTATYTLVNAAGCDSLLTLNLTINSSPVVTATFDGIETLSASNASSYQWINCSTNQPINGATNSTFNPTVNGTYAVIGFSSSSCSDTSNCIVVNNVGLNELNLIEVSIVPNPANDFVTVSFIDDSKALLRICDAQGKEFVSKIVSSEEKIDLTTLSAGVYFFELITLNGKAVKRIVKS